MEKGTRARTPSKEAYNSEYQEMATWFVRACGDANNCDECRYGIKGNDKCYPFWIAICEATKEHWDDRVKYIRAKEIRMMPIKPRLPPEEVLITCPNCKVQEVITLDNWVLESTVKFEQVAGSLTVLHHCGKGIYCEVTLTDGKTTVAEYVKRRKGEIEESKHRTTKC